MSDCAEISISQFNPAERYMSVKLPPFQWLLDSYREPVYRFLVASVGAQDADDCFQETFLAALRAYPRLQSRSNLRAWLFTIAHRKAMDRHRTRSRKAPAMLSSAASRDGTSEVWLAVAKLPAKQRGAVFHRFAGGLSYKEIGTVLGCSDSAARRSVHEGLKKLKEVFGK